MLPVAASLHRSTIAGRGDLGIDAVEWVLRWGAVSIATWWLVARFATGDDERRRTAVVAIGLAVGLAATWPLLGPVAGTAAALLAAAGALLVAGFLRLAPVSHAGAAVVDAFESVAEAAARPARRALARITQPTVTGAHHTFRRAGLPPWTTPVGLWLLVAVVMNAWQVATAPLDGKGWWAAGKFNWDWRLTAEIVERGYVRGHGLEAVFPGFPLAVRALHAGSPWSVEASGALISLVSGFVAALLFWRWTGLRGLTERARTVALAVFLLAPHAFLLFGVAYSDGPTLMLVVGAFVLLESDRPVAAGLVGALATFTRLNAVALVAALVIVGLDQARERSGRRRALIGTLLPITGIGAYAGWLASQRHDALYFWTVQQEYWGHTTPFGLSGLLRRILGHEVYSTSQWINEIGTALVVVGAALLVPVVARRYGRGYAVLVGLLVAMPFVAADGILAPGGRLLILAFPLAAVAGEWLAVRPRLMWVVIGVCATGSAALAYGFAAADCCW